MVSVLGLVLCGGESRRMGKDKALLELACTSLIRRALAVVQPLVDELVIGTGEASRYPELGIECVLDVVPGAGPLAGLCAGLELAEARGHEWIAVLACDTPRLEVDLFRVLLATARGDDVDACLFESASGMEPLCGVYRVSCLGPIRSALDSGRLRLRGFHDQIRISFVTEAQLPPRLRGADLSFNVNTPLELDEERSRLSGGLPPHPSRPKKSPMRASAERIG